jgi:hypothetical protein
MSEKTGSELSQSGLPIPDYLLPTGVHVIRMPDKPTSLAFDNTFDRLALQSHEKPVYWPQFVQHAELFLVHRYDELASKDVAVVHEFGMQYAEYLARQLNFIYRLYDAQRRTISKAKFALADSMNDWGNPASLADNIQKLSPHVFFIRYIANKLAPIHPQFRKISRTEVAQAVSIHIAPESILPEEINVHDPVAFHADSKNWQLTMNLRDKLSTMTDNDLLKLYFGPEEAKAAFVTPVSTNYFRSK